MSVTIKDVANHANVSPSTVSRVISNSSKISDATKKRVKDAMTKLNYKPNLIARSLTNKSTKTLGLLLPNSNSDLLLNPFFVKAMRGISTYAKNNGYYVLFTHTDKNEDEVKVLSDLVGSQWVDGIILTTVRDNDKCISFLKSINHPFVVIGNPNDEDVFFVDNDNVNAMFEIVDLLIKRGKKTIGFIGGSHEFNVTRYRLLGYLKALKVNNIDANLDLVYERDYTEESAYIATKELLSKCNPDAIVTTDDLIAFGVQRALLENNLNDISLVGFNNTILSQYKKPSITSIDIKADKLGLYAAKLLIAQIENTDTPTKNYIVDTKLIERESTKY